MKITILLIAALTAMAQEPAPNQTEPAVAKLDHALSKEKDAEERSSIWRALAVLRDAEIAVMARRQELDRLLAARNASCGGETDENLRCKPKVEVKK